jgi:hypothetical protein
MPWAMVTRLLLLVPSNNIELEEPEKPDNLVLLGGNLKVPARVLLSGSTHFDGIMAIGSLRVSHLRLPR